ncbi:MAG TPA: hypothetical protein VGP48_09495 [Stellaceae bacterium]|nr:hypothetical protein [Stellaceae bacterium]
MGVFPAWWFYPCILIILTAKWGARMKHWDFWGWLGFGALWIGGIVIALDTSFKLTGGPFRSAISGLIDSPVWGFSPVFFLTIGTLILTAHHFGWIGHPAIEAEFVRQPGATPQIDIHFEKRSPYEVSKIQAHHVLSTVRIGLRNSGGGALSNCKVYIDAVSPETAYPGGFPLLLDQDGFTIRHDDPEKLIDIAGRFDHVDKFKFSAPVPGGFWDAGASHYVDADIARTIVIKVEATERQRSATFRIWCDETKALHLEFISYVD